MKKTFTILLLLFSFISCSGNNTVPEVESAPVVETSPVPEVESAPVVETSPVPYTDIGSNDSATLEDKMDTVEDIELPLNAEDSHDCDIVLEKYRPLFYDLPAAFADLVGREAYRAWHRSRSLEERDNECVAVSFIKYFNIGESDFAMASEKRLQFFSDNGISPEASSMYEIYPIDLIFTLDNERINEYFLWRNSPVPEERTWRSGKITDYN